MKLIRSVIQHQRDQETRAEKQRYDRAVRAGGYGRAAQRDQRRADAIRRQRAK